MAAAIIALTLQVVISIILKMIDVMMKIIIFASPCRRGSASLADQNVIELRMIKVAVMLMMLLILIVIFASSMARLQKP